MKIYITILIFGLAPLQFLCGQEWSVEIFGNDLQGISRDDIYLGLCDTCQDEFLFGEDEYKIPPPPNNYVHIRFTNFSWNGYTDQNGNTCCQTPHFYSDKKSIHPPSELLEWNLSAGFEGIPDSVDIQLNWVITDIPEEYDVYLYDGDFGYNMKSMAGVILPKSAFTIYYENEQWLTNLKILIGGCASTGTTTYYWDDDGDGWGGQSTAEYCEDLQPGGWVSNNQDLDDTVSCTSNDIDDCDICDGNNIDKDCYGDCCGGTPNDVPGCGAFIDVCEICSGGNSPHDPNSEQDCAGVCFGNSIIDNCNECVNFNFNNSCLEQILGDGPENVFAHIHDELVSISWDAPSTAMNFFITGYKIYFGEDNLLGSTNLTEFTVTNYSEGTFCITALDEFANESQFSCAEATSMCNFEWSFHIGPNLVSLPCIPEENGVAEIMDVEGPIFGIIGEGQSAVLFNGVWVGALQEFDYTSGYWFLLDLDDIYANMDFNLIGFPPPENLVYNFNDSGNFLISYQGVDETPLSAALPNEIEPLILDIIGEGSAAHQLTEFNWIGSLTEWNLGSGYWIKIIQGFDFSWVTGSGRSSENDKLPIPPEFQYSQSTKQAFYFIEGVKLNNVIPGIGDLVIAYNGGRIIGVRAWQEGMIDIPAMGFDGYPYSAGYCEVGAVPEFKFYDHSSGKIHKLSCENTLGWETNGIFILGELKENPLPEKISLSVYPNPFNPAAVIEIGLPEDSHFELAIYNLSGQNIEKLANGYFQAGLYNFTWDGSIHPSGIYFVKFSSNNYGFSRKIMLVK